eukprot:1041922-Pelagomonas_calceolata.AAC.3
MLDENVSPAADQPESQAAGQPLVTLRSNSEDNCGCVLGVRPFLLVTSTHFWIIQPCLTMAE